MFFVITFLGILDSNIDIEIQIKLNVYIFQLRGSIKMSKIILMNDVRC